MILLVLEHSSSQVKCFTSENSFAQVPTANMKGFMMYFCSLLRKIPNKPDYQTFVLQSVGTYTFFIFCRNRLPTVNKKWKKGACKEKKQIIPTPTKQLLRCIWVPKEIERFMRKEVQAHDHCKKDLVKCCVFLLRCGSQLQPASRTGQEVCEHANPSTQDIST